MAVLIKVYQFHNPKSKANNKWYGRVVTTNTMTYKQLTNHMAEHNSVYSEDICEGVAIKLQRCLLEQLLEGKKVQFGDFGTFYLSAQSQGAVDEDKFNLGQHINGLRLRFTPSRLDINNLSSKLLLKKATLMNVKTVLEGKKKKEEEEEEGEGD